MASIGSILKKWLITAGMLSSKGVVCFKQPVFASFANFAHQIKSYRGFSTGGAEQGEIIFITRAVGKIWSCLLYTSDAADD